MKGKTASPLRVLVVDDERSIADSLVQILRLRGHDALAAYNALSALDLLPGFVPEVVIADVIMPGMNGVELAHCLEARIPGCRIVLFSGQAESSQALDTANLVPHKFRLYAKPIHPDVLLQLLEREQSRPVPGARGTNPR